MIAVYIILWALALICFFLATFGKFEKPRINLVALGLVFVSAVFLIQTLDSAIS